MENRNINNLSLSNNSTSSSSNSSEEEETKKETSAEFQERILLGKSDARNKFNYEELVNQLIVNDLFKVTDNFNVFMAYKENAFIEFGFAVITPEEKANPNVVRNLGWKVHVSIDDSDINNLAKGFNIIKNIVIDAEITCKVVMPDASFYNDPDRNGRQVTLYCCSSPEKDWEPILNKIENSLLEENIQFTHVAPGDNPVQGSLMMGYRNDNRGDDTYIEAKDTNYNYSNAHDIIEGYDLSPPGVKFHSRP